MGAETRVSTFQLRPHSTTNMSYQTVEIAISPELRNQQEEIRRLALRKAGIRGDSDLVAKVVRRSIDARKKQPKLVLRVALLREDSAETSGAPPRYPDVSARREVFIIGAGPAGYFAALALIRLGLRPIVIERGKDVRKRRRDLRAIQQFGTVNPNSNYCFGEGGAGTYSDGKLYTRATKRGDVAGILQTLVDHGATEEILVEAHPHIGSNKLPGVVSAIRQTIEASGGLVRFDTCLTDVLIEDGRLSGIVLNESEQVLLDRLILATGHSARDIYHLLSRRGLQLQFKPFALGVRVEHPQALIDEIQYGQPRGEWLPAASYQLTCQVGSKGVFSFCMCPGGLIVPAATSPGEIVVNGMSLSRRDSAFANSGMVVTINDEDISKYQAHGQLAGMVLQSEVEQACFAAGDGSQRAPAQRLTDFVRGESSIDLPDTSYIPGVHPYPIEKLLPDPVTSVLRAGLQQFGKRVPGYLTSEAVVVATESRTSAPVRIPRDPNTLMHPDAAGLFPCGEGAGFAGGIVSAALDGQNVAHAVAARVFSEHP